jgi:maltooligosyltrehalose trehalohydrolase
MAGASIQRRMPIGAELVREEGVHFRVWAPARRRVRVVVEDGGRAEPFDLEAEEDGYFSGHVRAARDGSLYRYRLDDDPKLYPDPASRHQPEGPHGPSRVIDPDAYRWSDASFPGIRIEGQIAYELHVGTFTREGTWAAAARELPELAAAGITLIEMMPVADFPGRFGWGYDGVNLFAPTRLYGAPDDLRRFVDEAHRAGIGVILDVVYNHLGPDGNYLAQFSPHYFTKKYETDWGDAINFDGERAGPVREYFLANAGHWIDEYHFDGLRLDATQCIFDASKESILTAIGRRVREAARGRPTVVVAENEPQHTELVRPAERGGNGLDALWNDDFHHSAMVALTGRAEAYYTDYRGTPQELVSAVKWGYLFQGQRYVWQKQRRGQPGLDVHPARFFVYTQNHDQVANAASGLRAHALASPGRHRAMTALLLLAPGTPMLFQGQEFAASAPFLFFADHGPELAALVKKGRGEFLAQFPSIAGDEVQRRLPDPADPATFERCKLDLGERDRRPEAYALHKDLIALRRRDPVFSAQRPRGVDGAVLGPEAFVLRYFGERGDDRLLLVNLGADLRFEPAPEPLLAPPEGRAWKVGWSSEDPRYGGGGTPPVEVEGGFFLPGQAAVVLASE